MAKDEKINKKDLSERDICTKFITPAVLASGWDLHTQIREERYFTDGRIHIKGDKVVRGEPKKADYILYLKPSIPVAIIEAKKNSLSVDAGLQQALEYGEILDIPFIYSSNGDAFMEHDRTGNSKQVETEYKLADFPSPEELWARYKKWKGLKEAHESIITQDYFVDPSGKKPRYYQEIAINRTIEAIAKGRKRALLVMATGTGKTYVAFQIIWRLWKAKAKHRILYLADRNILIGQAMNNDFKHFQGIMTKITNRKVDKSYEIYMALYQGVTGNEEWKDIYKQFSPDFFDLILVDECHRGSAAEDSAWREILNYFSSAAQIGMTATPKETKEVSNIDYFGEPIYTYSLRQGIDDGFLAPYKVIRISIDKDVEGWRPTIGQKDKYGYEVPDRIYNSQDFERNLVIDERTKLVAKKISEFMKQSDRYGKTIIFCVDIEHAERMRRAMVNENKDMAIRNPRYVVRITGDDEYGKKELDNFIDPASKYPVIATTSKLLNTGVDVQTCKIVALESNIQSMTEFKQIIGRGTRIREDYGKYFFTIMDFRQVTNLFADPEFDGEPLLVKETKIGEVLEPEEDERDLPKQPPQEQVFIKEGASGPRKYYINNIAVSVLHERVQYYDKGGKLITESLKEYNRKNIKKEFSTLKEFLQKWGSAARKSAIIDEMEKQGILLNELREEVGKDFDEFDLVCHVAYDMKPLTRKERAERVKKRSYFIKYGDKAREVIAALLDKYADEGIEDLENMKVLKVSPFNKFGTPIEIVSLFGGKESYLEVVKELERELYSVPTA